ncbi:MAG: MBL fold metallo-hydrolase [Myxococcales bacterium]|nr:MBL fold metallo-hydrolase [Myxococcales bacterium]
MQVRFWGVRGSIASPGADTALVGGNTSCVEVRCGDRRVVLDAGTGLRQLGDSMLRERAPLRTTVLLSHYHWDHIQGLPFFVPLYVPGTELEVIGPAQSEQAVRGALVHQMQAPVFPVRLDEVAARVATREVRAGDVLELDDVVVRVARGNHPGGVCGYRVEHAGASVVYLTDNEHYACTDPKLVAFAAGADLLVYDAQYTPEEYAAKVGWGHSTYVAGAALAAEAGVGAFALFHHDPSRTDGAVAQIEALAQEHFARSFAAREGLELDLARSPDSLCDRATRRSSARLFVDEGA